MSFGRRLVKARQQQPLEEDQDDDTMTTDNVDSGLSGGQVVDDADSKLTFFPPGAWESFSDLDTKVWKDGTVHGSSVVGAGVRFTLNGNALRVVGAITNEPTTLSLSISPSTSASSTTPRQFRYTSPTLEPGQNEFNHTFFLIDSLPTDTWTAELRWEDGSRVWLDWVELIPGGPLTLPSTTTLTSTSTQSASVTGTSSSAEPTSSTAAPVGAVSANKIGAIAGGVTASIIFLLTLLFFLILCLRRRRREQDYKDNPRSYEEMCEAPALANANEGGGAAVGRGMSVRMQLPGRVKVKRQVVQQMDPSADSSSGSGSPVSSESSLVQMPVASTSFPNPHPPTTAAPAATQEQEGSPSDTVLSSSLGTEPPLSPLPRYSNLGYGAGLQYSEDKDKKQRKSATLGSHGETEETDAGIMLMYTPPSPPPMPSPSPETPLPSAVARAPPPPRPPPRKPTPKADGGKVRVLPQTPWSEPSLVAVSALTPKVRSPPPLVHASGLGPGKTPPFPVLSTRPHAALMSPPPKLPKQKRYRLSLTGISSIHTSSPDVSPEDDMVGVGTFAGGAGGSSERGGHTEAVLRALNPPPLSRR